MPSEMAKAGLISEMTSEALDSALGNDELEEETDEAVDAVLREVAGEVLSSLPAAKVSVSSDEAFGADREGPCLANTAPRAVRSCHLMFPAEAARRLMHVAQAPARPSTCSPNTLSTLNTNARANANTRSQAAAEQLAAVEEEPAELSALQERLNAVRS